jgi:hypothetical protein
MRQAGVHGPGLVGAVHHFVKALVDGKGQALATKLGVTTQCGPAAVHIGFIRLFETLGRGDFVGLAVQRAALGVAADVQRKNHLSGKLARLFQHRVDSVGIGVGMLGHVFELVRDVQHLVQHKLHVAKGWVVNGHGGLLWAITSRYKPGQRPGTWG